MRKYLFRVDRWNQLKVLEIVFPEISVLYDKNKSLFEEWTKELSIEYPSKFGILKKADEVYAKYLSE